MNVLTLKIILGAAAAGYYLSSLFYFKEKLKYAYAVNGAAWILNAIIVGVNWVNNGYVPFVSMYQVLTFLGLCFTAAGVYMHFVMKNDFTARYFSICSGVVMTGCVFMNPTIIWHFAPALQSIWFVPHVFAYMLSYSLCGVASVLSIVWYFNKKNREKLSESIYNMVLIAFPFMTIGMFFGAIWANEVWGEFWSWDVKENWSLITWLLYALYLHARRSAGMKKYMYIFNILGLLALLMTFQGINLLGASSPHSYS